jgi:hypothetical protein
MEFEEGLLLFFVHPAGILEVGPLDALELVGVLA